MTEARLTEELARLRGENAALVKALDVCLEWIDAVPSDTPLPTMPGFDRDWVDNVRNRAALAQPTDDSQKDTSK